MQLMQHRLFFHMHRVFRDFTHRGRGSRGVCVCDEKGWETKKCENSNENATQKNTPNFGPKTVMQSHKLDSAFGNG